MNHSMKAYQRVRITTASPADLVVLFWEGMMRFTQAAAEALEHQRWAEAAENFAKACEIIGHLRDSLDDEVAAPGVPGVVESLDRTYALWAVCLVRAQITRDAPKAKALLPQMQELLQSWRTVARAATAVAS